jgi:hypothetical protein
VSARFTVPASTAPRYSLHTQRFRHFSQAAHDPCLIRTAARKTPGT